MWSSGTRLEDSAKIVSNGPMESDLPEYMVMRNTLSTTSACLPFRGQCGGAQRRARPSARRRRQRAAGPSTLSGAQTAKRRKAGSRVTTAGAFAGGGQALNADEDEKGTGNGFRKKAGRCVNQSIYSVIPACLTPPIIQQASPRRTSQGGGETLICLTR
jgi:hypothetical protein